MERNSIKEAKKTMPRIYTVKVPDHVGKQVRVAGWVQDVRIFGGIKFIIMKDRKGTLQLTLRKGEVPQEAFKLCDELTKESCIEAIGVVKPSEKARMGVELLPQELKVLNLADAPTPIDTSGKIQSDLSVRLDHRFLDLRNREKIALFEIRSAVYKFAVEYFDDMGFVNINSPKLTVMGAESGAELFEVDYFGRKAYLAQSPQIYKQMFVVAGFERVYEIGPVFRAEKSHTTRHLTEFTGIDFEQGFIESEHDVMDTVEGLARYIAENTKKRCTEQLEILGKEVMVPRKVPRISLDEAKTMLKEHGKLLPEHEDLDAEAEKLLGKIVREQYGEPMVLVYHYPWAKRPFYHMLCDHTDKCTKSFDLLWNGLEVATGSQREHRLEILKKQAKEKGVNLETMKPYLEIFQYGAPPHGGTGFGLDRIMEAMLQLPNIREAVLLPRDPERLTP
jgi:aspartyl-tRNA synthetase